MIRNSLALLLLGVLSACTNTTAVESSNPETFKKESGRIVAEAREFTKTIRGQNVTVVTVDMIHIAPEKYYHRVRDTLREYARKDASSIVLAEGIYCEGTENDHEIFAIDKKERFSPSLFPEVSGDSDASAIVEAMKRYDALPEAERTTKKLLALIEQVKAEMALRSGNLKTEEDIKNAYRNLTRSETDKVVKSGFLKRVTCKQYQEGKAGNINDTYKKIAAQFDLKMQGDVKELYPKQAKLVAGDLDLASLPEGPKMIFTAYVSCIGTESCPGSAFSNWIDSASISAKGAKATIESVLLNYRNDVLLENVEKAILAGHNTILLPWGEAHMEDLYAKLQKRGFVLAKNKSVELASCSAVVSNLVLKELFAVKCL